MLIDPTGHVVTLQRPAARIVSLIPSLTETLFAIGAGARLAGVSRFCIHPGDEVKSLPKVGGQKNPDFAKIAELSPDLLLLNREENRHIDYEKLAETYPVYVSDIRRASDVPDLLRDLGLLTGCYSTADSIAKRVEQALARVSELTLRMSPTHATALIWHKPLMTTNGDTYLSDLLRRAGLVNPFFDADTRYPEITIEEIKQAKPDWIIFPSEPHNWQSEEISAVMQSLSGHNKEIRSLEIDGEALTWYGARTATTVEHDLLELIDRVHHTAITSK